MNRSYPQTGIKDPDPFTPLKQGQIDCTSAPRFTTYRYLKAKSDYDNDSVGLNIYRALAHATSQVRFARFVTVRFSRPVTDEIAVQEASRKVKYKINKVFFGKRPSPLKFLFITEQDTLTHKSQHSFHLHYLVTSPGDLHWRFLKLPRALRLTFDKRNRLIDEVALNIARHEQEFVGNKRYEYITDPLDILIYKKTRRTMLEHTQNLISISNVKIENIYDQECLTDYVLKQMRFKDVGVDYQNSDITFSE